MAQLGNTVIKGSLYVSGSISGSVDNAVGDESGNNIKATYGVSLGYSRDASNNSVVTLLNKNAATISTISITPLTLDNVLQAGGTSSRAVTLSGTVSISGAITISNTLTQSGVLNVTNTTDYTSPTSAAVKIAGGMYVALRLFCASTIEGSTVVGAVWNDVAEFREVVGNDTPGTVVEEVGNDKMMATLQRYRPGCGVISDTFGFSMGKTEKAKTAVAIAGRVLVKYSGSKEDYFIGQAVCSGAKGMITPMSRAEIKEYPDAIIGYVSSFPSYEEWGTGNVKVGRRIWIRLK